VAFSSADGLALANDDSLQHLLSQLGLTLLDRAKEHIADGAGREAVKARADTGASNHVQVFSSSVVSAVHDRSDGQRVGNLQLDTVASSSSYTSGKKNPVKLSLSNQSHPQASSTATAMRKAHESLS